MSWLKQLFGAQSPDKTSTSKSYMPVRGQKYFEVPVMTTVFRCSDQECSCPGTAGLIPGETGFLYISPTIVELRRDALTIAELNRKLAAMQKNMGTLLFVESGAFDPIFMCRQAAEKRGLDLEVAADDAEYWANTGLAPLRATPKRAW